MINTEQQFKEQLELFKESTQPIIVFGATLTGVLVKKVLMSLGVEIECFMDNDPQKIGEVLDGKTIKSPVDGIAQYRTAKIILSINSYKTYDQIFNQLIDLGYSNVFDHNMMIFAYNIYLMKRTVSSQTFAQKLDGVARNTSNLVIDHTLVILTDQCTLNCRQCGHLVPYYKNPQHYDKHQIIESVKRFAESVDRIELLSLLGGEPMLHPDLVEICREVSEISNIKFIRLVTNGTVVPSVNELQLLKQSITYVSVSDYGLYSHSKIDLIEKLDDVGILYEVNDENTPWFAIDLPTKNKSFEESLIKYQSCIWGRGCSAIQNGEFHICNYSATGGRLSYIPKVDGDFVNLLDTKCTTQMLRTQLFDLLNRTSPVVACEYCNFMFEKHTPRAEQMCRVGE